MKINLTPEEEAVCEELLSRHSTPTEAVRKALHADACSINLKYNDLKITVRDIGQPRIRIQ
jgi:hypothetical protein